MGITAMVDSRFDVIIVGGGIIGSAIAYFLASDAAFSGTIAVIERDPSYRRASSALSAGSIRQQFSTPENVALARFNVDFLRKAESILAVDGVGPAVSFVESGYLFLATADTYPILEENVALQRAGGANIVLLNAAQLAVRFPWLRTDDLVGGALGLADEGWFDAYGLMQGFRRKATSLGVRYVSDEVVDLVRDGTRIDSVRLKQAGSITCGAVVNAAGPAAADVAAMAGVSLPVRRRKRYVFVFGSEKPVRGCPMLIDTTGAYVRPEGEGYIGGFSPTGDEPDPDAAEDDFEVDYAAFEERLWPTLYHRIPAFDALRLRGAWAGHYAMNTLDHNAILGPHTRIKNFYFANGFSGHGVQQAPGIGRAIAERILFGAYRSVDVSALEFERVAENRPFVERNVI